MKHTDNCGRTGKMGTVANCKMNCRCWCHAPRVFTFETLEELMRQRRSVLVPGHFGNRAMPAAILIHWPAILLMRQLRYGVYEYRKPKAV